MKTYKILWDLRRSCEISTTLNYNQSVKIRLAHRFCSDVQYFFFWEPAAIFLSHQLFSEHIYNKLDLRLHYVSIFFISEHIYNKLDLRLHYVSKNDETHTTHVPHKQYQKIIHVKMKGHNATFIVDSTQFLGPPGPLIEPSMSRPVPSVRPQEKSRSPLQPYKSSQDHCQPIKREKG